MSGVSRLESKFNRKFGKVLSELWYLKNYCQVRLEKKTRFDPPDWQNRWFLSVSNKNKCCVSQEDCFTIFLGHTFQQAGEAIVNLTEEEVRRYMGSVNCVY